MAVDAHTDDELRVLEVAEVHASQRVLMRQIHIDIGLQWSLSASAGLILCAVAAAFLRFKAPSEGQTEDHLALPRRTVGRLPGDGAKPRGDGGI